jgi:pyrroline-5-carboxylate reductase
VGAGQSTPAILSAVAEAATIGMIGSGNMASAMVEGWVRADAARAQRILVTDRGSGRAARLAELHGVTRVDSNDELVARADIVFLAVKPIDVERVLRGVAARITPPKAVASVAAGVQTVTIESVLEGTVPVFRLMPNVGVQVCAGTVCFAPGRFTNTDAEQRVLDWLGLLGTVVPLAESQFDAATALSGSGPAFLALLLEAFEDAGIVAGLSHRAARQLILSTAIGTARLLDEKELACSDLRRMVMSPGGTSAAGLHHLESAGVRGSIIGAVVAAMERARELG